MIRILASGLLLLGACAAAPAQPPSVQAPAMPPEQPRMLTPVEIVGDYAGKQMKLVIDGQTIFEGRGQLSPPGVRWITQVQPGSAPAALTLELEGCAVYSGQVWRTGGLHLVRIDGCRVTLIGS